MAKFVVKASEFKNVLKAVNDRKLAELKKEIIEILKKQDSKEVRKAVEYFESQEEHYSHLEKSLAGKWVEKAGYGIGTVRVWKGKKYKKIAPGKWARVFEKEGRGTNIAIGRLISKVNQIDNVEDLMAFVMANKQRFVDENGNDLPVLDKLRAAVDAKNSGALRNKLSNPKNDDSVEDYKKQIKERVKEYNMNYEKYLENQIAGAPRHNVTENELKALKELQVELKESKGISKPAAKVSKIDQFEDEMNRLNDAQEAAWEGFESGSEIKATPENSKKFYDKVKKFVDENNIKLTKKHHDELEEINSHSFNEALALAGAYGEEEKKKALEWNKETNKKYKGAALDLSQIDEFKESEVNEEVSQDATKYGFKADDFSKRGYKVVDEYKDMAILEKNGKYAIAGKSRTNYGKLAIIPGSSSIDEAKEHIDKEIRFAEKLETEREAKKEAEEKRVSENIQLKNIPVGLKETARRMLGHISEAGVLGSYNANKTKQYLLKKTDKGYDFTVYDINNDTEKTYEIPESEAEKHQNRSEAMKGNKNAYKGAIKPARPDSEKEVVGTFTITEDGKVEMPATKEVAELFDSLKKSVSEDEYRHFINECYYDGENFVSTDGRRLVVIKAGDIGLPKGYVKINTNGGKITVEKNDSEELKGREFPNYKRVMPGSANTQEVKFNNKALKEKLKEMKKDGAFNKKSSTGVAIEFKDGKAYLDGTVVGSGDVKFPEGQEPFIKLNGFYLMDAALAGDSSSMFLDKDNPAHKATDISTNNSDIVIMTMEPVMPDYESERKAKSDKKAEKDAEKARNRELNQERVSEKMKSKLNIDAVDKMANGFDKVLSNMDDERLEREYERFKFDLDKVIGAKFYPTDQTKVDNKLGLDFHGAVMYKLANERHPEVKEKIEAEMKKRGLEVKKSLFDGFLLAELLEEDVDDEEEDKEEDSLWNDYSAEQPKLFNSVEFKVREALNRCKVL